MATSITTETGNWVTGRQGDRRFVNASTMFFVPRLVWVLIALATMLIPNPRTAMLAMAAVSITWVVFLVQRRGGPYLTPSGVYFLASGVFVGVASWYLLGAEGDVAPAQMRYSIVLAFVLTVATEAAASAWCIKWGVEWSVPSKDGAERTAYVPPRQFLVRGLVLIVLSRVPQVVQVSYELSFSVGLVGVLIVVMNAMSMRRRITWAGDIALVAAGLALPAIWVSLQFRGGGRLTVAGLGIAVAMAWNLFRASGGLKLLLLLSIPVFLIVSGINRLEKIEAEWGTTADASTTDVIASGEGLESVYDSLDKFGLIMTNPEYPGGQTLGPRYGSTFVNTAVMPIPRSMWEGKPKGFGAELTELFAPHLVGIGQSFAALFYSEWYANFGVAGLVVSPVAIGWFIARLDRTHARLAASRLTTAREWWQMVVLLCLVASLGDLFWAGSFTYFSRGGMAAVIAWMIGRMSMLRIAKTSAAPGRPLGGTARHPELAVSRASSE